MEPDRARRLLPLIAEGGVVFLYSPRDARWLRDDPWIRASRPAVLPGPATSPVVSDTR
jgi:hypothetical protein